MHKALRFWVLAAMLLVATFGDRIALTAGETICILLLGTVFLVASAFWNRGLREAAVDDKRPSEVAAFEKTYDHVKIEKLLREYISSEVSPSAEMLMFKYVVANERQLKKGNAPSKRWHYVQVPNGMHKGDFRRHPSLIEAKIIQEPQKVRLYH